MTVKKVEAEPEVAVEEVPETNDPLSAPGFHVLADSSYVGTFVDREQAEHYIDGHLKPQDIAGEIVEGPAATE